MHHHGTCAVTTTLTQWTVQSLTS